MDTFPATADTVCAHLLLLLSSFAARAHYPRACFYCGHYFWGHCLQSPNALPRSWLGYLPHSSRKLCLSHRLNIGATSDTVRAHFTGHCPRSFHCIGLSRSLCALPLLRFFLRSLCVLLHGRLSYRGHCSRFPELQSPHALHQPSIGHIPQVLHITADTVRAHSTVLSRSLRVLRYVSAIARRTSSALVLLMRIHAVYTTADTVCAHSAAFLSLVHMRNHSPVACTFRARTGTACTTSSISLKRFMRLLTADTVRVRFAAPPKLYPCDSSFERSSALG